MMIGSRRILARLTQAQLSECGEELRPHVVTKVTIDLGRLGLDKETGTAASELRDLVEGRNECARERRIEPAPRVECPDLVEREVVGGPDPCDYAPGFYLPETIGEDVLDVGGAFERQVMERDEHAIAGDLEIRLDVVRALFDAQLVRRDRMLGRVGRCATVSDEDRDRCPLPGRVRSVGTSGLGSE